MNAGSPEVQRKVQVLTFCTEKSHEENDREQNPDKLHFIKNLDKRSYCYYN